MHGRMILAVLAATTLGATARADFVITSVTPAADQAPVVTEAQPKVLATKGRANPHRADDSLHPAPPRLKLAYGFGDQIPLSFAVHQIVPPAIKLTYGPGADRNALVDWKGGQTWNRVLFDAVKPLGLRLIMTDRAVEIRK